MIETMRITSFQGDYRFLSNFYPSPMTPPTSEHHYQAAKMANEDDAKLIWLKRLERPDGSAAGIPYGVDGTAA